MAAWNIFGHETTAEKLPAELRAILAEMKRERVAFEALTNAARDSSQNLAQLTQPVTEAQKVVSELQARVKSLERLVPVLATLDEQTENVAKVSAVPKRSSLRLRTAPSSCAPRSTSCAACSNRRWR